VYLDESGDLGFDLTKTATSRYFIVTALVCSTAKPIDKAVKKIISGFSKTEIRSHNGYLHAFHEKPATRRKLLGMLAGLDIGIVVLVLDKRRIFTDIADEPHVLYNTIVNMLMNRLVAQPGAATPEPMRLIASQRETRGVLNHQFVDYLVDHVVTPPGVDLSVEVVHMSKEKGLQAVDLISWSFFRKYEHNDPTYVRLVAQRVWEVSSVFG